MNPPRALDELRGLRAARWVRESTAGQYDHHGPEAQRAQQDRAIERYGLVDTGIEFAVAESGRTVWRHPQMAAMIEAARAGTFDVLVAGYSDRWQRNLRRTLELLEDHLHPAGVAILFADRRILTTDPHDKDELVFEARAAERYSEVLAERITEGYEARFHRHADQAGSAPLGFRRAGERHLLEVDPDAIAQVVRLFERYASGTVSMAELSQESGIARDAIRMILANPIYNGWIRRHRRRADTQMAPARWRSHPPVSDELWARVQEARAGRYSGGGGQAKRVNLLAKRLFCECGRMLKADAVVQQRSRYVYRRYRHPEPCPLSKPSYAAAVFETAIDRQLSRIRLRQDVLDRVRALASAQAPSVVPLRRRQIERELADRATQHAKRALSTEAYLVEHGRLTAELDALDTAAVREQSSIDPDRAVQLLRHLSRAWRAADEAERQQLVREVYQRITVRGERITEIELTPAAYRFSLDQALSESMALARPAGAGLHPANYRARIVGKRERARVVKVA